MIYEKNKYVIYTAITGDYDILKKPSYVSSYFDYIAFSNNKKIKSKFWTVIYVENDSLDNVRLARKIKILGHNILDSYEASIWVDGIIDVTHDPIGLMSKLDDYDLLAFKHYTRTCIYAEAEACKLQVKDAIVLIDKQIDFIRKDGYPENYGLIESNVLFRKNNDAVKQLMMDWWNMVFHYSRRDQLSFNYVCYKNNFEYGFIDDGNARGRSEYFLVRGQHKVTLRNRLVARFARFNYKCRR